MVLESIIFYLYKKKPGDINECKLILTQLKQKKTKLSGTIHKVNVHHKYRCKDCMRKDTAQKDMRMYARTSLAREGMCDVNRVSVTMRQHTYTFKLDKYVNKWCPLFKHKLQAVKNQSTTQPIIP